MSRKTSSSVAIIGTRGYPSYYGGFETAIRELAPHLADAGWRVRVYGRSASVDRGDPRVATVVTRGLDTTSLSTLSYGLTSVLHLLLRPTSVVLVMNVANGFWLPLLRLRGIPIVVNVDGLEWQRDKWSRLGKTAFWMGAWFTAKFANELIFDARAIGDYWLRKFDRNGHYIPYGGRTSIPDSTREFSSRYVLLVARFVPENSVEVFLRAACAIADAHDVDVVLVGAPPAEGEIADLARSASTHPRVHFLGHVSDDQRLHALWFHSEVYFHGHTVGGTNPALVQAMTLGCRILAVDTVYNREVLGSTGRFCAQDPTAIVDSIGAVLNDSRDLGLQARQRAQSHFTWDAVCHAYETVLAGMVSGKKFAHD